MTIFKNKIDKNNKKMSFFSQKICHIANYILTLQSFLTKLKFNEHEYRKIKAIKPNK